ncbi:MAG: S49 family peptidase [Flavobacteriales bacterium]|jgi:hypothetical protein|nr:S49 family peptidase [Flavobacteriales bacterium]
MPNWKEVLEEIANVGGGLGLDEVRRKYLKEIQAYSGRNVIAYYSGWLQRPNHVDTAVNDKDVSGFMLNIHKLDRSKGLDLLLHTPGGSVTATEALVRYLKKMFGKDIRAIVPQLSMSAGTMIAFACKEVVMGKHSSLGPVDPQMGNMPCQAVLAEFERAQKDILRDPKNAALWQFIISKYHPTFLGTCQHAVDLTGSLVEEWLLDNMCAGNILATDKILKLFSSHDDSKTHARHIMVDQCKRNGVKVVELEKDAKLQDLVLTTHHAFMHTFSNTGALKIIENHLGVAFIEQLPPAP